MKIKTNNTCRFCGSPLRSTFVDLGMSPLCENFLAKAQLNQMEPFYPLHVYVCGECFLVQLEQYVAPEDIFTEYAYFSSYSDSWLEHAKNYSQKMIGRLELSGSSQVIELASNDGYLLQNFADAGIPALGIEPAANVAKVALDKGIPTLVEFFGEGTAQDMASKGTLADLLIGNNVLAQVPDLNSFVAGMKIILKPDGIITMEFPHLLRLMDENQFDTIYHEHFSYFSLLAVARIFAHHGLRIFDVDILTTHGGSLRIYATHAENSALAKTEKLKQLEREEKSAGLGIVKTYSSFSEQVKRTKRKLLELLVGIKNQRESIVGYGAPGKGNTLLNYCGIRMDFLDYTVDRNPYKHGKFTPGTHIPIFPPERIKDTKPDYVFILPWNLKDEIMTQNAFIRDWGGKFIIPIPEPAIL